MEGKVNACNIFSSPARCQPLKNNFGVGNYEQRILLQTHNPEAIFTSLVEVRRKLWPNSSWRLAAGGPEMTFSETVRTQQW